MVLAGLQKLSLIDFPGRVSCVLFTTGCNFRCPYCHNPDLALGRYPEKIHRDDALAFLNHRRSLLDGVVISGGEPTLSPELLELCQDIKALNFAVKLDTNGSRPEMLARLIDAGLIDYVAMDIKTAISRYGAPFGDACSNRQVERSIRLIMDSHLDYEFRTTCVGPFVDEAIVEQIGRAIQGARQYALQTFQTVSLLDPEFQHQPGAGFSIEEMQRLRERAAPWVQTCFVR